MIERIAVLGGSSVYIPEFILSCISHNLNIKEIVLIGRAGKKLTLVSNFCQRILNKSGYPTKVVPSTDVAEGVAGAAYIINHVRVGGMQARIRDEKVPPQEGIIGDESLGAGGFANALRTLPVVFEMAEKIEKAAPEAVLINLTNPNGVIVEALVKYSTLNVIGVCDLPGTYVKKIAAVLRQAPGDICVEYIGLNHMGWVQDVKMNGRTCMARVLERLEDNPEDGFDYDLINLFRMIPTRTVGLYFHRDEILKRQQACARFRAEALHEAERQILKLYEDEHLCEVPDLIRARNAIWYEETIVPLIKALEGKKAQEIILTLRNDGAIRDLPEDCSVEVPARVCNRAAKARKVGSCPRFLKGLFWEMKESERLTVEAARHKSYEFALQALTVNPLVPSIDAARRFLCRLMKEEGVELH